MIAADSPQEIELSVLIPTYRRPELLQRCLQSVLQCSLQNIEVLVSDNASPDNTPEILGSFSDPRLRFWRNETNIGSEANVLKILQQASGKWIFCLTDDDYILPDGLERLMQVLQSNREIGVLVSSYQKLNEDGSEIDVSRYYPGTAVFSPSLESIKLMFSAAHILSRITARRELLDMAGTEKHVPGMYPQMYFVGAIARDYPSMYLDEPLVAHTTGNTNFWEYADDYMVQSRILMIKDLLPGKKWKSERAVLIKDTINEVITHHMPLEYERSKKAWLRHQRAVLKIPEARKSLHYWKAVFQFVIDKVLHRFRRRR